MIYYVPYLISIYSSNTESVFVGYHDASIDQERVDRAYLINESSFRIVRFVDVNVPTLM